MSSEHMHKYTQTRLYVHLKRMDKMNGLQKTMQIT